MPKIFYPSPHKNPETFRLFKMPEYTVAGKAIGFALEQPLHVVAFA
ncbi:MAG: hypothetical protein LBJ00_07080 [Planctomycetaceae bacterium]|nr:hypothetical protein [Planctomycetaceae bacterium]